MGKLTAAIIVVLLALAGTGYYLHGAYQAEINSPSQALPGTLAIPPGASAGRVAEILVSKGIGRTPRFLALYMDLSGQAQKLQAGTYRVPPDVSPAAMIATIAAGQVYEATVVIPEGLKREEIAVRLSVAGLCRPEEFMQATAQQERVAAIAGRIRPHLEGYLFPATYKFEPGISLDEIIGQMTKRFREVVAEVERGGTTKPQFSFYEKLIVASIVEKEAKRDSERPIVAAVFYNRLANRRRLESCATVLYALGIHRDVLSFRDLDIQSPYNTYRNDGLPPTPICSPGRVSLEAAWRPADERYLYFVSRGDGSHEFSYTIEQHNAMSRKYLGN